jgi:hypothetical protein
MRSRWLCLFSSSLAASKYDTYLLVVYTSGITALPEVSTLIDTPTPWLVSESRPEIIQ